MVRAAKSTFRVGDIVEITAHDTRFGARGIVEQTNNAGHVGLQIGKLNGLKWYGSDQVRMVQANLTPRVTTPDVTLRTDLTRWFADHVDDLMTDGINRVTQFMKMMTVSGPEDDTLWDNARTWLKTYRRHFGPQKGWTAFDTILDDHKPIETKHAEILGRIMSEFDTGDGGLDCTEMAKMLINQGWTPQEEK